MTSPANKDEKQAQPSNPQDLATVRASNYTRESNLNSHPRMLCTTPSRMPGNRSHACTRERAKEKGKEKTLTDAESRGEQTATQLEANLTSLESKLDAMLAAFERQAEGGDGENGDKTGSDGNGTGKGV
ncbi:hypothetical protein LLEC1_01976 [Akanthomyces lecanii]|uniref:Uncharacterized protein n=1 Tax=Cordyceps confragosa TaxID=2714763 RepID=A0A179IE29_CORDF|nr:hypothetical protein LLEC1_01976 [Akanthomyces lecanii]